MLACAQLTMTSPTLNSNNKGIDAFLLKFEAETIQAQLAGTLPSISESGHIVSWLKQAVDAGEHLMQLLDAHTHYRQNLYNWVPSRPYIRALMHLGIVHFKRGDYRRAEVLFNKMIGGDHGDHLGARHYLVIIFLESGNRGYGSAGFSKPVTTLPPAPSFYFSSSFFFGGGVLAREDGLIDGALHSRRHRPPHAFLYGGRCVAIILLSRGRRLLSKL